MKEFQVIVNKLNKRRSPVSDFGNKSNVVGIVNKGSVIESDGEITNGLGKWYKDKDGYFYSSIGLELLHPVHFEATEIRPLLQKVTQQIQPWFSQLLNIPAVWKAYNEYGENAITAVLDTGCDLSNPDISPNILKTEKLVSYGSHNEDTYGHGTRCTALVCCTNQHGRTIGVAPHTKVIAGKICNVGGVDDFNIIVRGIQWAIDNHADIVSLSHAIILSDTSEIQQYYQSIQNMLKDKQILVFACCGNNENPDPSPGIRYPAAFSGKNENIGGQPIEKIISVGATDNKNQFDSITLLNDYTMMYAPGRDIISYQLNSIADASSGTSMATPIAAGVAALAVSYLKKKNNGSWNALYLRRAIYETADPIVGHPPGKIINPSRLFKTIQ